MSDPVPRFVSTRYWIGDVVHHRMADDDQPGIVTRVEFSPTGLVYEVTWRGRGCSAHYELELSSEKPVPFPTDQPGGTV